MENFIIILIFSISVTLGVYLGRYMSRRARESNEELREITTASTVTVGQGLTGTAFGQATMSGAGSSLGETLTVPSLEELSSNTNESAAIFVDGRLATASEVQQGIATDGDWVSIEPSPTGQETLAVDYNAGTPMSVHELDRRLDEILESETEEDTKPTLDFVILNHLDDCGVDPNKAILIVEEINFSKWFSTNSFINIDVAHHDLKDVVPSLSHGNIELLSNKAAIRIKLYREDYLQFLSKTTHELNQANIKNL